MQNPLMIIIYITCKDETEAEKLGKKIVEEKLAACYNFFCINSGYPWQGKIQEDNEYVLLLKTKEENYEKIKVKVKQMHSYEIPCILKLNVEANKEYEDWLNEQVA